MRGIKKIVLTSSLLFAMIGSVCINKSATVFNGAYAYDDITNIWGTQISEFMSRDYAPVKNHKYTGKYYKVGIMGHRRVVKFSDEIYLKTKEIESFTNTCSVGSLSNLTITNETSHVIGQKTSSSVQIQLATSFLIKAAINLESIVNIGAETGMTVGTIVGSEYSYWEETISTLTVSYTLDLSNILPNKTTVRYSKVACFIQAKIADSYTEEQGMFGNWYRVSGTTHQNYIVNYHISDLSTFVYNDNTFGDQTIGEYLLNDTITTY